MPLSLAYWLCWFLWILAGFYIGYQCPPPGRYGYYGGSLLLLIMLFVLGLRVFGAPIK